ncbi:MAG: cell division protein FtsZ [Candidatus Methanomethylophilaceae archaeon]|nr:cell division protein FtsZ [Candidatus Methanomethylophilaceae archaeon]MBR7006462.1 cell division protein FtsZ [Candidatus Methanomethylophilaceae archaeon]
MISKDAGRTKGPHIAVVGVGGAGCNVISAFAGRGCPVDTIAINTDKDALHKTVADEKIYICKAVLKGEGTRGDAELGRRCADIHKEEIRDALLGYDFVFVIGGLGGGTGTGAMPAVIDAAAAGGAKTYTLAISPFLFEGRRKVLAREAYQRIKSICEDSFLLDNDKVVSLMDDADMDSVFARMNESIVEYVSDIASGMAKAIVNMKHRTEKAPLRHEGGGAIPIGLMVSA